MNATENKQLLQDDLRRDGAGEFPPAGRRDGGRLPLDHRRDRTMVAQPMRASRRCSTELFAGVAHASRDRIKMIAQRILAEGDLVVVEARGENVTKVGPALLQ